MTVEKIKKGTLEKFNKAECNNYNV
jgi:hypothetical protein